jgi:hypothetical protein
MELEPMPLRDGKLTPRERVFVKHCAETGSASYAATKAGYRGDPSVIGAQMRAKPAISAEIQARQEAELFNELRPIAQKQLRTMLESEKTGEKTRFAAIKLVIDKTGVMPAGVGDDLTILDPALFRKAAMDALRVLEREAGEAKELVEDATIVELDGEADDGVFG